MASGTVADVDRCALAHDAAGSLGAFHLAVEVAVDDGGFVGLAHQSAGITVGSLGAVVLGAVGSRSVIHQYVVNHAVVGIAHHHADVAPAPQTDVLQDEVADDGTVSIAEESHVVVHIIIIVMISPYVLDGVSLSVEHAAEGMLGGTDGCQSVPLVTVVALLNDIFSKTDGIVAHIVAAVDSCGQVLQVLERRDLHSLGSRGGFADESEGVGPSHIAILRLTVFLGTGARHIESALACQHRRCTGMALVSKQVVVLPGRGIAGSAPHLRQLGQIDKGTAADAVERGGQRHLLQRRAAHEGEVANPGDTLADGDFRQLVAQAEGQLVHLYAVVLAANVHRAGNGNLALGILRYAGVLSVA